MLGKKKKHRVGTIDTLIGQNTELKGDVSFTGGLHIDGIVHGNVSATEGTDSTLTLSENGKVEGEVRVPYIILNGEVQGDVYASEKIELAARATIKGNVYYNLLEMAMGAAVNGSLVHQQEFSPKTGAATEKKADVPGNLQPKQPVNT
jgi:cytoskeletal protein CcmA (bactofilin family)